MNCADSIKTAEYESIGKEIKKVKKPCYQIEVRDWEKSAWNLKN